MAFRKPSNWGQTKPPPGAVVNWGDSISAGLVGYWLFNEGAGFKAQDVARGNVGAVQSGTTWAPGKFGTTLKFNGSTGYVLVTRSAAIEPANAITFTQWVLFTVNNVVTLDKMQTIDVSDSYQIYFTASNTIRVTVAGTTLTGSKVLSGSTWYCIVGTYDGANIKLFINGVADGSTAKTGAITYSSLDLWIGRNNGGGGFFHNGPISDTRIYNRALQPSELQRLYTEPFAGLVAPKRRIISQVAAAATDTDSYVFGGW